MSNFPILHTFPLRYHPPRGGSFLGALMRVDVGAESFVSGESLFSGGGPPAFLSAATGKATCKAGMKRHLDDFTDLILALGTALSWRAVYDANIIWIACHNLSVNWIVEIGVEFEPEFDDLHEDVRTEILALTRLLQRFGPQLGRPRVDTLNGSRHANMKELRFSAADGEWRVAFAFDPKRKAILLVAGDKAGVSEKRFYRELVRQADRRFGAHLIRLKEERT